MYYTMIQSLYRHVVCNVSVSCKANGDRNQLGAWLDTDLIAEQYNHTNTNLSHSWRLNLVLLKKDILVILLKEKTYMSRDM